MRKKEILISLSTFKNKETLTSFLKSFALKRQDTIFEVECSKQEFIPFSGYENIRQASSEKPIAYDAIFSFGENNEDKLIGFGLNKEEMNSLVIIDENENPFVINEHIEEAITFSKIFYHSPQSYHLVSGSLIETINSETRFPDKEESIDILFKEQHSFIVISKRDFSFLKATINGYLDATTKSSSQEGIFASIGRFFFKNYIPSNKIAPFSRLVSNYEIALGKATPTIALTQDMSFSEYQNLLELVSNLKIGSDQNV